MENKTYITAEDIYKIHDSVKDLVGVVNVVVTTNNKFDIDVALGLSGIKTEEVWTDNEDGVIVFGLKLKGVEIKILSGAHNKKVKQ